MTGTLFAGTGLAAASRRLCTSLRIIRIMGRATPATIPKISMASSLSSMTMTVAGGSLVAVNGTDDGDIDCSGPFWSVSWSASAVLSGEGKDGDEVAIGEGEVAIGDNTLGATLVGFFVGGFVGFFVGGFVGFFVGGFVRTMSSSGDKARLDADRKEHWEVAKSHFKFPIQSKSVPHG